MDAWQDMLAGLIVLGCLAHVIWRAWRAWHVSTTGSCQGCHGCSKSNTSGTLPEKILVPREELRLVQRPR